MRFRWPAVITLAFFAFLGGFYTGLSHSPRPSCPCADVLRDGHPTRHPTPAELLSGRRCLPMHYLVQNRPIERAGFYARSVACERNPA